MLPTPRALDSKGSGTIGSKSQAYMKDKHYLCGTVETQQSGSLNPNFVEWLMGYPQDWTALPYGPTKTRKSRVSPKA